MIKIYFHFQFLSRIHLHKFDSPQPLPFWVHVAMSGWCAPCARACLVADDDGCVLVSRALKKQKASCARLASLRRGCSRYACILPRRNIDRVLFRPQRRHSTFPSSFVSLQPLAPPFLLSLLAFHRRIPFFFLPLPLIFSLSFFFLPSFSHLKFHEYQRIVPDKGNVACNSSWRKVFFSLRWRISFAAGTFCINTSGCVKYEPGKILDGTQRENHARKCRPHHYQPYDLCSW